MIAEQTYRLQQRQLSAAAARHFIANYRHSIRQPGQRYPEILQHIPQHSYVLDFGCGWGAFAEWICEERHCSVDAVDADSESIKIARDFIGERDGLRFAVKVIDEIPPEVYDVVVSTQVAEHTFNPGNYIAQCNRVLKRGGLLIISVPNIATPRHFLSALARDHRERYKQISLEMNQAHNKTHHHLQAWDGRTFARLVCALGFEYVDHAYLEGVALPGKLYWRKFVPSLFRKWSFTMMFKARKVGHLAVDTHA